MKLKEYMGTHEGAYTIAETNQAVSVENLDVRLRELEIEPYVLGEDVTGHRKIHLYRTDHPFHVVTLVEEVKTPDSTSTHRSIEASRAVSTTSD